MRSELLLLHVALLSSAPAFCISLDYRNWHWSRTIPVPWRRDDKNNKNVPPEGYHSPLDNGGSMLTKIPVTFPMGQGEPLNAIIAGNSDPRVLIDAEVGGGLRNYFLSFGFSGECLGQHAGSPQGADLGDGNGYKNETSVIRWNYGDPELGSCKETVQGGNHFRYWVQDGPQANSGAIFLATSYEMPIAQQHDIVPNGYNLGRDWLIGNITQSSIPSLNLTDNTNYTGTTSWNGYTYETNIRYVSGLLENTNYGVNHNATVGIGGINSTDGLVAVLSVRITQSPPESSARDVSPRSIWHLTLCLLLLSFISLFS